MNENHKKYYMGMIIGLFLGISILGIYCLPMMFCRFIAWLSGCEECQMYAKNELYACQVLYDFVE